MSKRREDDYAEGWRTWDELTPRQQQMLTETAAIDRAVRKLVKDLKRGRQKIRLTQVAGPVSQ